MKAFSFRLEQALRWRETQVSAQKSRVAAAAGQASRNSDRARLAKGGGDKQRCGPLSANQQVPRWRCMPRSSANRARGFAISMRNSRSPSAPLHVKWIDWSTPTGSSRLLENLKQTDTGRWRREFDRELAAFADEAFLCRIPLKTRSKLQLKNGRARSSGG